MNSTDNLWLQMQLMTKTAAMKPTAKSADYEGERTEKGGFQALLQHKQQDRTAESTQQKGLQQADSTQEGQEDPGLEGNQTTITEEQRVLAAMLAAQAVVVVPVETVTAETEAGMIVAEPVTAVQAQPQDIGLTCTPMERMAMPTQKDGVANQAGKVMSTVQANNPIEQGKEMPQPVKVVTETQPEQVQMVTGKVGQESKPEVQMDMQSGQKREETEVVTQMGEKPLFHAVDATPVKVGDAPAVVDTRAADMDNQLAKEVDSALLRGEERIELKLSPEHLGTVTVEMTRHQDGSLHVVLAGNEKAVSVLSEHASALGGLLQTNHQGAVNVEVQRQQENQQAQQQNNQDGRNGQNPHQQERRQSRENQDFLQQLRLGLIPVEDEAS